MLTDQIRCRAREPHGLRRRCLMPAVHVLMPTDIHVAAFHSTWPVSETEKTMTGPERELYDWFAEAPMTIDQDKVLELIALQRDIDYMAIRTKHLAMFVTVVALAFILVMWLSLL